MSETTVLVIPGSEFDAAEHGHDMASILRTAQMYGVRVPHHRGPRCFEMSPDSSWACTRADGHTRRHAATYVDGHPLGDLVVAVWHQQDW